MATKKQTQSKAKIVKQGAKFGLVGLSNAVIDFTLYTGLAILFKVPLDKVFLVKFFSGSIAMINSFYWNRTWTFKSKAKIVKSGSKFLITTLVSVWESNQLWYGYLQQRRLVSRLGHFGLGLVKKSE